MYMKIKKEEIKQWVNDVYKKIWELLSLYAETEGFNRVPEGEAEENPQDFVKGKMGEIKKIEDSFYLYMDEQEIAEVKRLKPRLMAIDPEYTCIAADPEVEETFDKLYKIYNDTAYFFNRYFDRNALSNNVVFWWGAVNPNLVYYNRVFDLMEKYPKTYMEIIPLGTELPGAEFVAERNAYFEKIKEQNERENLNWSKDRFFQEELLNTLKLLFERELKEYL